MSQQYTFKSGLFRHSSNKPLSPFATIISFPSGTAAVMEPFPSGTATARESFPSGTATASESFPSGTMAQQPDTVAARHISSALTSLNGTSFFLGFVSSCISLILKELR